MVFRETVLTFAKSRGLDQKVAEKKSNTFCLLVPLRYYFTDEYPFAQTWYQEIVDPQSRKKDFLASLQPRLLGVFH